MLYLDTLIKKEGKVEQPRINKKTGLLMPPKIEIKEKKPILKPNIFELYRIQAMLHHSNPNYPQTVLEKKVDQLITQCEPGPRRRGQF